LFLASPFSPQFIEVCDPLALSKFFFPDFRLFATLFATQPLSPHDLIKEFVGIFEGRYRLSRVADKLRGQG
jgi:hypothetical protein